MATRPIPSRVHGVLDYSTGATLMAAPAALGLGGTAAGRILRGAGAGTIAYSLLTRYELGVAKVLPYRAHLAVDAVAALGLAAAPWAVGAAAKGPRHWAPHAGFALFELAAVALSDPSGGAGADGTGAGDSAPAVPTAERTPTVASGSEGVALPEGAEAALAARGAEARRGVNGGGVGSGTGPGSDPRSGGLQT